jgi:two-component system cell cycle response regulator DivK
MPTFLYIEDDAVSRQVMKLMLIRRLKHQDVTIWEDSTNFLEKILALPTIPDVIFVDIHMEPVNGFGILEVLRAQPQFKISKIIALTASVMNEEVDLLRQAGFDGVIGKPLDGASFPDLLDRILQGEKVWRPT